jgi:hypothetical protein
MPYDLVCNCTRLAQADGLLWQLDTAGHDRTLDRLSASPPTRCHEEGEMAWLISCCGSWVYP